MQGLPDLVQLQAWKNDDITIDSSSSSKPSTDQKLERPRLYPTSLTVGDSVRRHFAPRSGQHSSRPILYYCPPFIIILLEIFWTQSQPFTDLLKECIHCISYPAILLFIIRYCPRHRFRREWHCGLAVLVSWFVCCCLYDMCFELVMPT